MTTFRPLIRGMLRKWKFTNSGVEGYVYQDTHDVYEDGEHISLLNIKDKRETANFWLFESFTGPVWRADKDDQVT